MNSRQQVVYAAIVAAAEAGAPCPTNDELDGALGNSGSHDASAVLCQIEKQGLVAVTRFGCGREVTITATGKSTAPFTGVRNLHWRKVAKADRPAPSKQPYRRPDRSILPPVEILPPAVFRDPCPRCGTRADLGCGHRQVSRLIVGASI